MPHLATILKIVAYGLLYIATMLGSETYIGEDQYNLPYSGLYRTDIPVYIAGGQP